MYLNIIKMKSIKKYLLVLILPFFAINGIAQKGDIKQNLVGKWKMDTELMKPIIEKMMNENPQTANLDALNKNIAVSTALSQISENSIEYKVDGTMVNSTTKGVAIGTWKWDIATEELTTKSENKPEKKFKIISLTKTKLHLKTQDNKDLYLTL